MLALLVAARLAAAVATPEPDAREDAVRALVAGAPDARIFRGPRGEVALATGLAVPARDGDPVWAARAFLDQHGAAFGVGPGDALVLRKGVLPGDSGPVVFERQVRGLTVFGGHVTVALGAGGEIHAASAGGPLPAPAAGFRVDEAAARRLALARVRGELLSLEAGWSLEPDALRPVWIALVLQRQPHRSFRVVVDGATGRTGAAFPLLQHKDQARLYRISPAKPYAVTDPPAACAVTTDSSGNKKHATCAPAELVALQGLAGNGTLTGDPAPHKGRTTAYNCKGGTTYDPSACTQTFHADGNGDFIPANLTDWGTSKTDPMGELQAYYFVDVHSRFMDSLDPSFAGLPLIPGFTNAYGPNQLGLPGNGPMDNAFFDPASKIMVFGQGSSVDFAYDGEVVFHEMTHAACGAIGDVLHQADALFPAAGPLGLWVDPLALNEGNADTFAFMAPGVNDPYLAEFDALDEISVLISKVPVGPNGWIRNEGPDLLKTCQGKGTAADPGRDGEAHDDGEIWAEFTWEAFQGLKPVPLPAGAAYTSVAAPAMFKALQQVIALPNAQQTYSAFAAAFESQVRSQHGAAAGDYVRCLAERHGLAGCDGQAVTVYSGEKPFNDQYVKGGWKSFYYSKAEVYTDPSSGQVNLPAGFDGVPASFQWKLHVPAGATGLKVTVCDATPALGPLSAGGSGKLHVSYGKPVSYAIAGSGVTADWTYPAKGSWTVAYKDCGGTLGAPHPTVATLSGAACTGCQNSSNDDGHAVAEGDWYFLPANTGGGASFVSFLVETVGGSAPARPTSAPVTCTLGPLGGGADGGSDGGADAGSGADAGHADGGADAGTSGADGGADGGVVSCAVNERLENGVCVGLATVSGGCASGGAGVLALLGLAALLRRRRSAW